MISAETIRTIVGILGNITALGLFLSPAPTFYRIWKKGTVEEFSAVPYLAGVVSCMVWLLYGLPMVHPHSSLVLTVNGTGLVIEGTYVVLFLVFSGADRAKRCRVLLALFALIAFVGTLAVLVLTLVHTYKRRSFVVGILGAFFGMMMYAAPLSVMKMVINTKSVEYMPFYLSFVSFLCASCWTVYALIHFDPYLIASNGPGVIFSTAQLMLHLLYHKSTKKQMEERKKMELRDHQHITQKTTEDGNCIENEKIQFHKQLEA